MDGHRFDRLTRTFATPTSRRRVLKTFAGALLGGAAAARVVDQVTAACPAGQVAASGGRCICKSTGRSAVNGVCPCGAGQTDCGGVCKDLSSDLANCGACGIPCPDPERQDCRGGLCVCLPGLTLCGNRCVDLQTDPDNCGACGTVCPSSTPVTCQKDRICSAGSCTFNPLPSGTICRVQDGGCDLAEACDGVSLSCPADLVQPAGFECRPAQGLCDLPATCNGTSKACPSNPLKPEGTECHASAGPCDPAEVCDGVSHDCPPDTGSGHQCPPPPFSEGVCCPASQSCIFTGSGVSGFECGVGGAEGQHCRVEAEPCNEGLDCDLPEYICRRCGALNQICCGSSCDSGLACIRRPFDLNGTCLPCGGLDEVCCGSVLPFEGTCDAGYACVPDSANPLQGFCRACGDAHEACCLSTQNPSELCGPNLICTISPSILSGECLPQSECGHAGQRCCGFPIDDELGNCVSGLTCELEGDAYACR